ncbi:hypothetical protein CN629_24195 [Bacillus toyonensis]|nr:hypothetical protein CN629_24195 [Bacillus toyonensis]
MGNSKIPLFPSSPLRKKRRIKLGKREQVGFRRGTLLSLQPQGIQLIGVIGGTFCVNRNKGDDKHTNCSCIESG